MKTESTNEEVFGKTIEVSSTIVDEDDDDEGLF